MQEFLATVRTAKGKTWSNDDALAAIAANTNRRKPAAGSESDSEHNDAEKESDNEYEELPTVNTKTKTEPTAAAASSSDSDSDDDSSAAESDAESEYDIDAEGNWVKVQKSAATESKPTESEEKQNSSAALDSESSDSDADDENTATNETKESDTVGNANDSDEEAADAGESGRLFVRNLPYTATPEEVEEYFSQFGEFVPHNQITVTDTSLCDSMTCAGQITEVHLPRDSSKRLKGFGYVLYMIPEHAVQALAETDGKFFQGRILHVMPAQPKPSEQGDETDTNNGNKTFKSQREEQRRVDAAEGKESSVWNTLLIRR